MAMDCVFAHDHLLSNLAIRKSFCQQGQHFALARSDRRRAVLITVPDEGVEQRTHPVRLGARAHLHQAVPRGYRLALGRFDAAQSGQARRKFDPRLRGLEGSSTPLEAVHRILQERSRILVVATGGRDHAVRQDSSRSQWTGGEDLLDLFEGGGCRLCLVEFTSRQVRSDE